MAAEAGSVECIKLLLESGAKVSVDDTTVTPLHSAVLKGRLVIYKGLDQAIRDKI